MGTATGAITNAVTLPNPPPQYTQTIENKRNLAITQAINGLANSAQQTNNEVAANSSAITSNTSAIATNASHIAANTSAITALQNAYPALVSNSVVTSNKTVTASTSGQMLGLGASYTPQKSGNLLIAVSFDGSETGTTVAFFTLQYGTGTAPSNGATLVGTNKGIVFTILGPANQLFPASATVLVAGLTVGTTYWFDFAAWLSAGSGVSMSADNPIFVFVEL